jgi:hypothetical protein
MCHQTKSNPITTNITQYVLDLSGTTLFSQVNLTQVLMAFNLLNIPILPLVKASIIFLLLRAGSVIEWLKKALYAILIFTVGSALVPWFLYIFICPPQTGNTWKPRTFGNLHCMGRHRMGEMLIWVTCANLLTDLLIFPIPFIIVRRMMSARLRSRMVVLAVFTSSLAYVYSPVLYRHHSNISCTVLRG